MRATIKTGLGEFEIEINRGEVTFKGYRFAVVGDHITIDLGSLSKVPAFKVVTEPEPVAEAAEPVAEAVAKVAEAVAKRVPIKRVPMTPLVIECLREHGAQTTAEIHARLESKGATAHGVNSACSRLFGQKRIQKAGYGRYAPIPEGMRWERVEACLREHGPLNSFRLYNALGNAALAGADRVTLERRLNAWRSGGKVERVGKQGKDWGLVKP